MKVEIGAVDTRVFPYYKKLTYKPDGNCFQFQTEFQRPESDVDINEGIQLIMNVPQKSLSWMLISVYTHLSLYGIISS